MARIPACSAMTNVRRVLQQSSTNAASLIRKGYRQAGQNDDRNGVSPHSLAKVYR